MSDLTVLVSPSPLYVPQPRPLAFNFTSPKRNSVVSRPVTPMITLEKTNTRSPSEPSSPTFTKDQSLLSPPINTWKRPKTHPRPASAPPARTSFDLAPEDRLADFFTAPPRPIFTNRRRNSSFSSSSRVGELLRPPPPLLRPTTFWRKTKRSGVTGASYSPSSHLIRRSTFIAAGLSLDRPVADLSAFCVESRIGIVLLPPDFKQ